VKSVTVASAHQTYPRCENNFDAHKRTSLSQRRPKVAAFRRRLEFQFIWRQKWNGRRFINAVCLFSSI